jgi:hypothetical protein
MQQPDHAGIIDTRIQPICQDVVMDPVEKRRQAHTPTTRLHVCPYGLDRVVCPDTQVGTLPLEDGPQRRATN